MIVSARTLLIFLCLSASSFAAAQPAIVAPAPASGALPAAPQPAVASPSTSSSTSSPAAPSAAGPSISLEEAIRRAQGANSAYAVAKANAGIAGAEKVIARSALLPGVTYNNQYLYTQGNFNPLVVGTPTANGTVQAPVRFIANNTVHEYISQATITETIGGSRFAQLGSAAASAAAAKAQLEVARRGLVSAVVAAFYGVLAADQKAAIAQRALDEANDFDKNTRQREAVGEVAHADVIKADLEVQQRERDLSDAQLAAEKARIDLGIFLFPNPTSPYAPAGSLDQAPTLPAREEIQASAPDNPDLKAALSTLRAANFDVRAARFGYLPDLTLNWFYGIDAPQFAMRGPDGTRNLGYSGLATLDIPIWDWFATHEKVKQSEYRREQARVDLTETQRQLLASLDELYREAEVAHNQLASLDQSVQTAAESLRLARMRYTAGEGTVLEVVDAQNSLVLAEAGRVDGAVRYYTALAGLQTLTGRMP